MSPVFSEILYGGRYRRLHCYRYCTSGWANTGMKSWPSGWRHLCQQFDFCHCQWGTDPVILFSSKLSPYFELCHWFPTICPHITTFCIWSTNIQHKNRKGKPSSQNSEASPGGLKSYPDLVPHELQVSLQSCSIIGGFGLLGAHF